MTIKDRSKECERSMKNSQTESMAWCLPEGRGMKGGGRRYGGMNGDGRGVD